MTIDDHRYFQLHFVREYIIHIQYIYTRYASRYGVEWEVSMVIYGHTQKKHHKSAQRNDLQVGIDKKSIYAHLCPPGTLYNLTVPSAIPLKVDPVDRS